MPKKEATPPPGLSAEQLAEWWRTEGKVSMNRIKTLAALERICAYCDSLQPCTGTEECTVCGHSLKGAKRVDAEFFEPQ